MGSLSELIKLARESAGMVGGGGAQTSGTPQVCTENGWNCGVAPDGKGGVVDCGTCPPGEACGQGGPNRCGGASGPKRGLGGYGEKGVDVSGFESGGYEAVAPVGLTQSSCMLRIDVMHPTNLALNKINQEAACAFLVDQKLSPTVELRIKALEIAKADWLKKGYVHAAEMAQEQMDALKPPPPGCHVKTCAQVGASCGSVVEDGCGSTLDCGGCPAGQVCKEGKCVMESKQCATAGQSVSTPSDCCKDYPFDPATGLCSVASSKPAEKGSAVWWVLGGVAGATVLGLGIWGVVTAFQTAPKRNPVGTAKDVPKSQIKWLVDKYNVGTPDAEVRSDIEARARKAGASEALIRACGKYAVDVHQRNRALYVYVMGGMRSKARKIPG